MHMRRSEAKNSGNLVRFCKTVDIDSIIKDANLRKRPLEGFSASDLRLSWRNSVLTVLCI